MSANARPSKSDRSKSDRSAVSSGANYLREIVGSVLREESELIAVEAVHADRGGYVVVRLTPAGAVRLADLLNVEPRS